MNSTSNAKIIAHPDFKKLKDEVERLRVEISMLILEKDTLIYQECKNIEMAYLLSVGALEYRVYELECTVLRLKRKVELIQSKINRQETIYLSDIDETLDKEFAEYQERLNELISDMNNALDRSKQGVLSESDSRELKKIYREIVKALHPDMNQDIGEERLKLFYHATEAYRNGDVDTLRTIATLVLEIQLTENSSEGLAFLAKEAQRLSAILQNLKDKIEEVKFQYPYTMKALVENPASLKTRKSELSSQAEYLQSIANTYVNRINELIGLSNE